MGIYDYGYTNSSYDSYYPDLRSRDPTLTSFGSLDRPYLAGIDSPYPTHLYPVGDDSWRLDVDVPHDVRYLAPTNYVFPRQNNWIYPVPGPCGNAPRAFGGMPHPQPQLGGYHLPPPVPGYPGFHGGALPRNPPRRMITDRYRDDVMRERKGRWRREIPICYSAVVVLAVVSCFLGNILCGIPAVVIAVAAIGKLKRDKSGAVGYRNIALALALFAIISALVCIGLLLYYYI